MPRPKKPGAPEPKKRSRNGCWPCKNKKVKCGEEKPKCLNCERQGESCDYSIRLNWEGRIKRKAGELTPEPIYQQPSVKHEISSPEKLTMHHSSGPENDLRSPYTERHHSHDLSYGSGKREESESSSSKRLRSSPPLWETIETDERHSKRMCDTLGECRDGLSQTSPHPLPTMVSLSQDLPGQRKSAPISATAIYTPPPNLMLPPINPPIRTDRHVSRSHPVSYSDLTNMSALIPVTLEEGEGSWVRSRKAKISTCQLASYSDSADMNDVKQYEPPEGFVHWPPPSQIGDATIYSSRDGTFGQPFTPSTSSPAIGTPSSTSPGRSSRSSALSLPLMTSYTDDPRRLSVNSLLSSPTRLEFANLSETYGIDRGSPDLDIPNNDDNTVLGHTSLASKHNSISDVAGLSPETYGMNSGHSAGEYYSNQVTVTIPRILEPLPAVLLENQMNMLYFHHFLNHTARILVPHDCEDNPFRIILPQMAVRDIDLMHLLLAYSASHRARLLKHSEPSNRIAIWVRDVFPSLRRALNNSAGQISNTVLATAIMLASLEIIAPAAFEVQVPWQEHLNTAREIITARGPLQPGHNDRVASFLYRWFVYLDVVGSLSGGKNTPLLYHDEYSSDNPLVEEQSLHIDCFFGFTSRCVTILARVADLARRCDSVRIDPNNTIREDWQPTDDIVSTAMLLKFRLKEARKQPYAVCPHRVRVSEAQEGWDSLEMMAMNDAFHWAGLIHLDRRVLGKSSDDAEVQEAVRQIVGALCKVRKGGPAEACLLFPMFTAGCDAKDDVQRSIIMERIESVEGSGMTQVNKAKQLMLQVWSTGKPWETLVKGEFFG